MRKWESNPIKYECDKEVIMTRLLPAGQKSVTITSLFDKALPKFCLFCIQHPSALYGRYHYNPYVFEPLTSLQVYINNTPYFPKPLTNNTTNLMDQLYKITSRDVIGSMMINTDNLVLNQFFALSLTHDKTYSSHYNIKRVADTTRIELEHEEGTESLVLVVYALYDQQIVFDSKQNIEIIE